MYMDFELVIVLISIFTFIQGFIFFKLLKLNSLVKDKLLNETQIKLTNVMYDELSCLGYTTESERALWSYFREKLNHVYMKYNEFKSYGIDALKNEQFESDLLGNSSVILSKYYTGFPIEFISKIDAINAECYELFKRHLAFDYQNISKKREFITVLQNNTLSLFRKNLHRIYVLYTNTKHLIQDEDRKNSHLKKTFNTASNQENMLLEMNNMVEMNVENLQNLLSEKGRDSIREILDFILILSNDEFFRRDAVLIGSRFSDYESSERRGIENPSDLERIKNSLLELIIKLQQC